MGLFISITFAAFLLLIAFACAEKAYYAWKNEKYKTYYFCLWGLVSCTLILFNYRDVVKMIFKYAE